MRTSVITIALALAAAVAFGAGENCPPRYSYCGFSGPEQWKNLPIPSNECGGQAQSPVDITQWTAGSGSAVTVDYKSGPAAILNTGHDIEVEPEDSSSFITIDGSKYFFKQFHFHVPSEHALKGQKSRAELHLVHQAENGNRIAVIAVLLSVKDSNPVLAEVFKHLPTKVCDSGKANIALQKLLPATIDNYYTYAGSLTTPPCSQVVTFYIANGTGITLSQKEYGALLSLGENARPLQKLNGREVRLVKASH